MSSEEGEGLEHLTVLLEGDAAPDYRVLVSCWTIAAQAKGAAARLKRWAECSGLPLSDVRRYSAVLFLSGICRADGTCDPDALVILRAAMAKRLEELETKKRGKRGS